MAAPGGPKTATVRRCLRSLPAPPLPPALRARTGYGGHPHLERRQAHLCAEAEDQKGISGVMQGTWADASPGWQPEGTRSPGQQQEAYEQGDAAGFGDGCRGPSVGGLAGTVASGGRQDIERDRQGLPGEQETEDVGGGYCDGYRSQQEGVTGRDGVVWPAQSSGSDQASRAREMTVPRAPVSVRNIPASGSNRSEVCPKSIRFPRFTVSGAPADPSCAGDAH